MKNYPEVTVGAIIFNPENRVLLCKSTKWNNQFVIPGGHIELGERMEDALIREVKEETGLDIYDIQLISLLESIYSKSFNGDRHFIFIDYLCHTNSSNVVLNDEAEEYVWAELNEVLDYDLGGFTKHFFNEFLGAKSSSKKNIFYNYVNESLQ